MEMPKSVALGPLEVFSSDISVFALNCSLTENVKATLRNKANMPNYYLNMANTNEDLFLNNKISSIATMFMYNCEYERLTLRPILPLFGTNYLRAYILERAIQTLVWRDTTRLKESCCTTEGKAIATLPDTYREHGQLFGWPQLLESSHRDSSSSAKVQLEKNGHYILS